MSKDPSGLTYTEIAIRLGIDHNRIAVMKCQQTPKFEYIQSLHPQFELGYRLYEQLQEKTISKVQEIYYELEDKRKLSSFSRFLYEKEVYGCPISWITSSRYNYFKSDVHNMHHSALLRKLKVLEAYKEYKNETTYTL